MDVIVHIHNMVLYSYNVHNCLYHYKILCFIIKNVVFRMLHGNICLHPISNRYSHIRADISQGLVQNLILTYIVVLLYVWIDFSFSHETFILFYARFHFKTDDVSVFDLERYYKIKSIYLFCFN